MGSEDIICDAPNSFLYGEDNIWIFEVWQAVPGPSIGDFRSEYSSIADVLEAILDYYFGEPSKMNPPELLLLYEDE